LGWWLIWVFRGGLFCVWFWWFFGGFLGFCLELLLGFWLSFVVGWCCRVGWILVMYVFCLTIVDFLTLGPDWRGCVSFCASL